MKKLTTILIALSILFAFAFSGCDKNTFTPGEDNEAHPILWQYNYGKHQTHADVIPAMDENGNVFFGIQDNERVKNVYVFANDKDGNALWDKQYTSTNYVDLSRVMYIDNKLIYTVVVYDDSYDWSETIYCLNAADGTELWHYSPDFINKGLIEAMAVTSKYLVVGAKWGGVYPNINELHYFDLSSGALVKSIDLGDDEVKLISIVDNNIYLGVKFLFGKSYVGSKVMKMNLESNEIDWTFTPDFAADIEYYFEQQSIPIDANGRAFCIIRKMGSVEPSNIYIVNADGTLANTIGIPEANSGNIYNVLIDKENNFYTAIHTFAKYSPNGSQIWEFYTGTTVENDNFRTGCVIGDNDTIYHAESGGILNVNTIGEIAWAKYTETNFSKPGYPLLTNDGNMVVVGDVYVTCVKGDGAKIQNAPWPRVYQNNGNTSSR